jgi:hypothetical protein
VPVENVFEAVAASELGNDVLAAKIERFPQSCCKGHRDSIVSAPAIALRPQ